MAINRPRQPHEELTTPDNENILGTLTPKAWAKMNVVRNRAEWRKKVRDNTERQRPVESLMHQAIRSSGSIEGEHRKDLVEGIQGAKLAKMALGMTGVVEKGAPEAQQAL